MLLGWGIFAEADNPNVFSSNDPRNLEGDQGREGVSSGHAGSAPQNRHQKPAGTRPGTAPPRYLSTPEPWMCSRLHILFTSRKDRGQAENFRNSCDCRALLRNPGCDIRKSTGDHHRGVCGKQDSRLLSLSISVCLVRNVASSGYFFPGPVVVDALILLLS
jgi:hypothetical protein